MSGKKKHSFMSKLFRKMSVDSDEDKKPDKKETKDEKRKKLQRMQTVDPAALKKRTEDDVVEEAVGKSSTPPNGDRPKKLDKQKSDPATSGGKPSSRPKKPRAGGKSKRKRGKKEINIEVDVSKPIDWPATPEIILAYHRKKAFLNNNEEWLVVELNEYECLVENVDIIKIIAKHSKFFEVEPDELWDEFFEFMEEVPTYDEIINYDVWQEFRDEKYPY